MDLRFGIQLAIIGLTFFMLINASALLVYAVASLVVGRLAPRAARASR